MRYHKVNLIKVGLLALFSFLGATNVQAAGQTQFERQEHFGMSFYGTYIQPVLTTKLPKGMMMPMTEQTQVKHEVEEGADIHLELRVEALKDNPYAFAQGSWIPYLAIDYRVEKVGTDWFTSGSLMPMVANDGPHYGNNVKLNGVGKYNIKYRVKAPNLMLHMDKETAPKKWWQPFIITWDLTYLGIGKKGGY
jgi:uncharacterized protein involved in high-affinity Fe2+ transport